MTGHGNFTFKRLHLPMMLTAALALAACDENGKFEMPSFPRGSDDTMDTVPTVTTSTELVERDVEAPEVFQITSQGLWDGRPSLGGVWVAHPDAVDPERVIIRNTANGKFVIGALFRRERENPGPALQVSSDAADALGLLAGAPSSLNVTALRREEAAIAPPETTATTDFDTPSDIAATPLDPIANAAAAIEAAETPAPTPAPAATSSLSKPFIQIGIFSVQANANRTAEKMRGAGLTAKVIAQDSQGKKFWRVVVGPSQSAAARADALTKVKSLGFADAYFVTN